MFIEIPFSGRPLKLSELVSVEILRTKGKGKVAGKAICSVSQKEINFNEAVAIATSGKVMLKTIFDSIAKKTGVCPVTGQTFEEADVIPLRKAASGKASSGVVEAKHWRPALK